MFFGLWAPHGGKAGFNLEIKGLNIFFMYFMVNLLKFRMSATNIERKDNVVCLQLFSAWGQTGDYEKSLWSW